MEVQVLFGSEEVAARYAQKGWLAEGAVVRQAISSAEWRLPGSSWNFGDDPHGLTVTR
jgi:hypothetical protein